MKFGKQHYHPLTKEQNVGNKLMDISHLDVSGPTKTRTFNVRKYYATFISMTSLIAHGSLYPMCMKSEVFSHFLNFKSLPEQETNQNIQCLQFHGD